MKLSTNVTYDALFLMADLAGQKSHDLKFLHNHRKKNREVFFSVASGFLRVFLRVSYAGLRPLESSPDDRRRALSDPAASQPASSGHWVSSEEC